MRAVNKKDFFPFFCFANRLNRRLKGKVSFDAVVKKLPIVRFISMFDIFMLWLKALSLDFYVSINKLCFHFDVYEKSVPF